MKRVLHLLALVVALLAPAPALAQTYQLPVPVSVANGGTAAKTAAAARASLAVLGTAGGTMTGSIIYSGFDASDIRELDQRIVSFGNSGSTPTVNWNLGNNQTITLNAATVTFTFTAPSNTSNAAPVFLEVVQDGTGSRVPVWPSSVLWSNSGAPPVFSVTAGAKDYLSCKYFGATRYICGAVLAPSTGGGTTPAVPITGGGTGQITAGPGLDALSVQGADIASASTTDLCAATGHYVRVTGTVTITGLGTCAAGVSRTVKFTGALQLTHNGTSLILPGAANITTVANDVHRFTSLGSGNWQCTDQPASATGALLVANNLSDVASAATSRTNLGLATVASSASASDLSAGTLALARGGTGQATAGAAFDAFTVAGASIASAATTSIGGQVGYDVHVTGSTGPITSFGNCTAGVYRIVHFDSTPTITHNATSLILLTARNRVAAAGDVGMYTCDSTNNWREAFYNYVGPDPWNEFDAGNSSTAQTIDFSKNLKNASTLTGNVTYTFTSPPRMTNVVLTMIEDATGGRTITLPASVKFTGGVTPTWVTTANAVNVLACTFRAATTLYYCSAYTQ